MMMLRALAFALVGAGPALACEELPASWDALSKSDLSTLLDLAEAAPANDACPGPAVTQIHRWAALGLRAKAYAEADDLHSAEPYLLEAVGFARPWQLLVSLGDAAREREAYGEAAGYYQDALSDMFALANPSSPYWDPAPSAPMFATVKRRADATRLAASTFVSRSGRPVCQPGALRSLGVVAVEIVAPVRFAFDSSTFTAAGSEAVEELRDCLGGLDPQKVRQIRIVGHTDATGTEGYNLTLSKDRAAAVQDYLEAEGLALPFVIEGRGETEPFTPDSPESYSQEVRDQMNRRVEVDVVHHDDI